ncbi:uncharacterized protein L969DRAFT_309830 [Mixia osmundae IAM 14324]|uniref:Hydrophobin n=1 Tax=Mixia osmundae (strain CBS 9802 / IAM 14324 / JCM 22182 / KY 12970) TaxID=764103 RepID=G7DY80_MIXOS|nr:uncharacterized protein L969DRAFT_309830 [Mixia osmundae IAM 14324]KEI41443.1 hypothetical protein L969DRAFT_309830 [Mixia osmundae IAM 14324]GAA95540.1 hypothetical protein E5Q_02195 [Mixia osmundae IAM 14324]
MRFVYATLVSSLVLTNAAPLAVGGNLASAIASIISAGTHVNSTASLASLLGAGAAANLTTGLANLLNASATANLTAELSSLASAGAKVAASLNITSTSISAAACQGAVAQATLLGQLSAIENVCLNVAAGSTANRTTPSSLSISGFSLSAACSCFPARSSTSTPTTTTTPICVQADLGLSASGLLAMTKSGFSVGTNANGVSLAVCQSLYLGAAAVSQIPLIEQFCVNTNVTVVPSALTLLPNVSVGTACKCFCK